MAMDVMSIAEDALSLSSGLSGEVEVYAESARTTAIKVYGGSVESLVSAEPQGVGVRVIDGARTGYAYTADLSREGLESVARSASANAQAGDPDVHAALPEPPSAYPEIAGLWREGVSRLGTEDKVALALEAERSALSVEEVETVEEAAFHDGEWRTALLSSTGVSAFSESSFCYVLASAHASRDGEIQTGLGFSVGREPGELDAAGVGREAGNRARALLGAAPCPTGRYTVVLDREVHAAVLSVLARALSAEAVQRGRSALASRVGEAIAAEQVELWDDGLHPQGMATHPFDGEGVPQQCTPIIREGILETYLYGTYTARREGSGVASTGNMERGSYRSTPSVGPTNLIVTPGRGGLEELMGRVGEGIYISTLKGLHSGASPITGEFSVGVGGHLIEGGGLGRPVREVTLASDLVSLLSQVTDRGGDERWIPFYGSVLTPSVAVADIVISGE